MTCFPALAFSSLNGLGTRQFKMAHHTTWEGEDIIFIG